MTQDNAPQAPVTRTGFEAAIIKKAWDDPSYKKRLLSNPKEVIQEELQAIRPGAKLPEQVEVYVHEETPGAIHISLPISPAERAETNAADWMNSVAGGVMGAGIVLNVVTTVSAVANSGVSAAAVAAVSTGPAPVAAVVTAVISTTVNISATAVATL